MAIHVTCACGQVYNFRDEAAGRSVKCGTCGGWIEIPVLVAPPKRPTPAPTPKRTVPVAAVVAPPARRPPAARPAVRKATSVHSARRQTSWVPAIVGSSILAAGVIAVGLIWYFSPKVGTGRDGGTTSAASVLSPASAGTGSSRSDRTEPATSRGNSDTSSALPPSTSLSHSTVLPPVAADPIFRPAPVPADQAVVSIVKGEDPATMVPEALMRIGGLRPILRDGQTVVIKPNLVTPEKAKERGLMTDVRIVEALVKEIQKTARCRIIIAEGCATKTVDGRDLTTADAFRENGYVDLARRYGVELKDLNTDQRRPVRIPGLVAHPEYPMPETIMACDVLIDVPVLKTHTIATVTLGIKNMFGLMPMPKNQYHGGGLLQTLVDINKIRRPDLVVVDGLVGTEGNGPLSGTPIKMDVVLAGRDVLAVDTVAATVMGFDARSIPLLSMAAERNLGQGDLAKIEVRGRSIDEVKKPFARPELQTP
jgi:uncharacterized protein (DUF362 family)